MKNVFVQKIITNHLKCVFNKEPKPIGQSMLGKHTCFPVKKTMLVVS